MYFFVVEMNSDHLLLYIFNFRKKIMPKRINKALNIKFKKLIAVYVLMCKNKQMKKMRKRRYWVHPIFSVENRKRHGTSDNLIKELYFYNDEFFINYFRMNVEVYDKLLNIVGPYITKQNCIREAIPPNIFSTLIFPLHSVYDHIMVVYLKQPL